MFPPILSFLSRSAITVEENKVVAVFDKGKTDDGSDFYCVAIYDSIKDKTIFRMSVDEYTMIPISINPPMLASQIHNVLKAKLEESKTYNNS